MEKQIKIINTHYIILVLTTILSFVPNNFAQFFSLFLALAVLISAYWFQKKDGVESLLYNHMTYMIGTIWIGSIVILIGAMLMGLWVYLAGDQSVILNAISTIESGVIPDENGMKQIVTDYIDSNKFLLFKASLFTLLPAILYMVYRVANGMARAHKGYRIANPKSWL